MEANRRPLFWVGSSKIDLKAFPPDVQDLMGYALDVAQQGGKHRASKPLSGFGGAGVLEIVDDFKGDTYRAVCTVKLADAVYVLHAFEKKSKHGIGTPKREMDIVRARLKRAEAECRERIQGRKMQR